MTAQRKRLSWLYACGEGECSEDNRIEYTFSLTDTSSTSSQTRSRRRRAGKLLAKLPQSILSRAGLRRVAAHHCAAEALDAAGVDNLLCKLSVHQSHHLAEQFQRDGLAFFLSTLVQRFHFSTPEGSEPPTLDYQYGFTLLPAPFTVTIEPRLLKKPMI